MINYFGTDLSQAGHYMWFLQDNQLIHNWERGGSGFFSSIPFNPEKFPWKTEKKGQCEWIRVEWQSKYYTILAICGAPSDDRGGTKMVFWIEEHKPFGEFLQLLKDTPIVMRLINKCQFPIPIFDKL